MKQKTFTILSNEALTANVFSMWLAGDTTGIRAGQFVNIEVPNWYLRRPISVCEIAPSNSPHKGENSEHGSIIPPVGGTGRGPCLRLVYKVVGTGTKDLSLLQAGEKLNVLTCLGNGYDLSKASAHPLLVGGGIGVPPLLQLAKDLRAEGKEVTVVLGFNTATEVILEEEFKALGCKVYVCTMDGSYGTQGTVVDVLAPSNSPHKGENSEYGSIILPVGETGRGLYSYFYTCGPIPMLKALYKALDIDGEFSLEERMGCGFGACMGCTLETRSGNKRVCKEGPVFKKEELLW